VTWILARSAAEPDREFPAVAALAAMIVAWRAGLPRDAGGLPPELQLAAVTAARGGLPGGAAIAVRARLAADRVERLGYVFAPDHARQGRASLATTLMAAILAAQLPEPHPC
jgi:hypothetical protein